MQMDDLQHQIVCLNTGCEPFWQGLSSMTVLLSTTAAQLCRLHRMQSDDTTLTWLGSDHADL